MTRLSRSIAKTVTLGALVLAPATAQASDTEGNFALRGYGARSCATYLTEISDPGQVGQYGSWLMGYTTARNRLQAETFDILPFADGTMMLQAVRAVCADRTSITVEDATNEVIRAIAPLHQRSATAIITIARGEKTVSIRQAALESLQVRLAERGLYSGPRDGAWNEDLAASVQEFQLREKIVASGLPDFATLIRALVS